VPTATNSVASVTRISISPRRSKTSTMRHRTHKSVGVYASATWLRRPGRRRTASREVDNFDAAPLRAALGREVAQDKRRSRKHAEEA